MVDHPIQPANLQDDALSDASSDIYFRDDTPTRKRFAELVAAGLATPDPDYVDFFKQEVR